jgi:hypothetical protein
VFQYGVGTRAVFGERITIQPGTSDEARNYCDQPFELLHTPAGLKSKGDVMLGGGWEVEPSPGSGKPAEYKVVYWRPFSGTDPRGGDDRFWFWGVRVENVGAGPIDVSAFATCGRFT